MSQQGTVDTDWLNVLEMDEGNRSYAGKERTGYDQGTQMKEIPLVQ